jgi:hypothetical protein
MNAGIQDASPVMSASARAVRGGWRNSFSRPLDRLVQRLRREAARGQEQVQPLPETPHAQRHRSVIESTI